MDTYDASVMEQEMPEQLTEILCKIDDADTMRRFLRDVMTEKEITEVSARLEAARMLTAGASYAAIIKRTKLSSRTVARIRGWLTNGTGGYDTILQSMHHLHIQPDSSE